MAKQANTAHPISSIRRHKIISFVILLVLGVIGFLVYSEIALQVNKHDFQQARSAIDTVYADIVHQVGQPDNFRRNNDCSRPNQEFESGPLSCSVNTDFIYGVDNETNANDILAKVEAVISRHSNLLKATLPLSQSIKDSYVANTYYHRSVDYYKTNRGLACEVSYTYDTPGEIDLQIRNSSQKPLEISSGCSGFAEEQYYPLD